MTSSLDVRLGAQEPTILHEPPDVHSLDAATECIELANAYGVADGNVLSESQEITLRNGLGERADGSWAATRIADFGPRQGTGKNDKIAARELAGLLLFDEQLIIHTAHEFPTANESFLRLVAVFDAWDELRKKVARIRYANGEQGIELLTGQRLKYRARTGGSGRGFAKADLVVYDEAQHLGREHVAASGPAKMANPNSQTWYAGSGGLTSSAVAWEIRRQALLGKGGRLAYTEMTGEQVAVIDGRVHAVPPADPTDRDIWYQCIPGLGRWVTEESVEALLDELGPALFMREILCVWDPEPGQDGEWAIPSAEWAQLANPEARIEGPVSWSASVAPDRQWGSIGVAGRTVDGKFLIEFLHHRKLAMWSIEDEIVDIWTQRRTPIRLHREGPEKSLIAPLRARGVEVIEVSTADVAAATGMLLDMARDGRLVHNGRQPSMTKALSGAVLQMSTAGAVVWSQKQSSVEITPLQAVTIALGGVTAEPPKAPPKPARMISF